MKSNNQNQSSRQPQQHHQNDDLQSLLNCHFHDQQYTTNETNGNSAKNKSSSNQKKKNNNNNTSSSFPNTNSNSSSSSFILSSAISITVEAAQAGQLFQHLPPPQHDVVMEQPLFISPNLGNNNHNNHSLVESLALVAGGNFPRVVSSLAPVPQFGGVFGSIEEAFFVSSLIGYASFPSVENLRKVLAVGKGQIISNTGNNNNSNNNKGTMMMMSVSNSNNNNNVNNMALTNSISQLATAASAIWRWGGVNTSISSTLNSTNNTNTNNNNNNNNNNNTLLGPIYNRMSRSDLLTVMMHSQPLLQGRQSRLWMETIVRVADEYYFRYLAEVARSRQQTNNNKSGKNGNNNNNANASNNNTIVLSPSQYYWRNHTLFRDADFDSFTIDDANNNTDHSLGDTNNQNSKSTSNKKLTSINKKNNSKIKNDEDQAVEAMTTTSSEEDESDEDEDEDDTTTESSGSSEEDDENEDTTPRTSVKKQKLKTPSYKTKIDYETDFKLDLGLQRSQIIAVADHNAKNNKSADKETNNNDLDTYDNTEDDANNNDNGRSNKEDKSLLHGTEVVDEVVTLNKDLVTGRNSGGTNNTNGTKSSFSYRFTAAGIAEQAKAGLFDDITYLLEEDFHPVSRSCVLYFDEQAIFGISAFNTNNNNQQDITNNTDGNNKNAMINTQQQQQQQPQRDYLSVNNSMLRRALQEELGDGSFSMRHRPRGQRLAAIFAKNSLQPDVCRVACDVLRKAATKENMRHRTNGGLEAPKTGIVGYYDYLKNPIAEKCRLTAFAHKNLQILETQVAPLVWALHEIYKQRAPDHFHQQNSLIPPQYRLFDTCFSTLTVNDTFRTAQHTDSGDFKSGLGLVAVIGGDWNGCHLALPSTGKSFKMNVGDVVLFDTSLPHGNTEWEAFQKTASKPTDPNQWRISIVAYLRSGLMSQTCEEENEKRQLLEAKQQFYAEKRLSDLAMKTSLVALSRSSTGTGNELVDLMYFNNSDNQHFAEFETPPLWLPPKIAETLNDPQRSAISFAHRRLMKRTGCVLALSMGLGKTLLGLSIAYSQLVMAGGGGVGNCIGALNFDHSSINTNNNKNNSSSSSIVDYEQANRNLMKKQGRAWKIASPITKNSSSSSSSSSNYYDNTAFNPFRYALILTPKSVIPHWKNEAEQKWAELGVDGNKNNTSSSSSSSGLKFVRIFVNGEDTQAKRGDFDREISEFFAKAKEFRKQTAEMRGEFIRQNLSGKDEDEDDEDSDDDESSSSSNSDSSSDENDQADAAIAAATGSVDSSSSSSSDTNTAKKKKKFAQPKSAAFAQNRPILLRNGQAPGALIIINPDYAKRFFTIPNVPEPSVILFDEGHRGTSTRQRNSGNGRNNSNRPDSSNSNIESTASSTTGILQILNKYCSSTTSRVVLSGTPLQNASIELYRVISWCNPVSTDLLSEVSFKNSVAPLDHFLKDHSGTTTTSTANNNSNSSANNNNSNTIVTEENNAFIKDYFAEEENEEISIDDDASSLLIANSTTSSQEQQKKPTIKSPFVFDRKQHAAAIRAQEFLISWMRGTVFRAKISSRSSVTSTLRMPVLKDYVVVCTWSPAQLVWLILLVVSRRIRFVERKENKGNKKLPFELAPKFSNTQEELAAVRTEISKLFSEHEAYFREVASQRRGVATASANVNVTNSNNNNNKQHLFVPSLVYDAFLSSAGSTTTKKRNKQRNNIDDSSSDTDNIDDQSEDNDEQHLERLLPSSLEGADEASSSTDNNNNNKSATRRRKIFTNSSSLLSSFSVGCAEQHRVAHLTCHPLALANYDEVRSGLKYSWCNFSDGLYEITKKYVQGIENQWKNANHNTSTHQDNSNSNSNNNNRIRQRTSTSSINIDTSSFEDKIQSFVQHSNKLTVLLQIARETTKVKRESLLVFTNYRASMACVHHTLVMAGLNCSTLHGDMTTSQREECVNSFNNNNNNQNGDDDEVEEGKVLVLSTKVGGVGIDLTSAATAVIFEPWWNPQVDLQAIARIFRPTQKAEEVTVFRLCVEGTLEETILLEIQLRKLALFACVVDRAKPQGAASGNREVLIDLKEDQYPEVLRELNRDHRAEARKKEFVGNSTFFSSMMMMGQNYNHNSENNNNNNNDNRSRRSSRHYQSIDVENEPVEFLLNQLQSPELRKYCETAKNKKSPVSRVFDFSDLERLMDDAL